MLTLNTVDIHCLPTPSVIVTLTTIEGEPVAEARVYALGLSQAMAIARRTLGEAWHDHGMAARWSDDAIAVMKAACRRERADGLSGRWHYSLPRHRANYALLEAMIAGRAT